MNPANAWLLLTSRSLGVAHIPGGFGALKPADIALALSGLDRQRFLMGMAALAGDRDSLHELTSYVHIHVIDLANAYSWTCQRGSEAYRRLAALAVFEVLNCAPDRAQDQLSRCFVCFGKGRYEPPPEQPETPTEQERWFQNRIDLRCALRRVRRLEWRANLINQEIHQKAISDPAEIRRKVRRLKRLMRWINRYVQMTDLMPTAAPCELCRGSGRLRLEGWHRAWLTGFSEDHWNDVWAERYAPIPYELKGWISDCLTHVCDRLEQNAA